MILKNLSRIILGEQKFDLCKSQMCGIWCCLKKPPVPQHFFFSSFLKPMYFTSRKGSSIETQLYVAAFLPCNVIQSPLSLSCSSTFKIMFRLSRCSICFWINVVWSSGMLLWDSGELFKDNYLSHPSSQSWTFLDHIISMLVGTYLHYLVVSLSTLLLLFLAET